MRRRVVTRQSTTWADPADVADKAREMPDGALLCRDLGHAKIRRGAVWVPSLNCFEQTLACSHQCGTEWVRLVNQQGEVISSHIHYADGYLMEPGTGRMDAEGRNRIRVEVMRREVQTGDVTAPPAAKKRTRGNSK